MWLTSPSCWGFQYLQDSWQVMAQNIICSPWKWKLLSVSKSLQPHGLYSPWNSPRQNTGVGSLSLLQVIFPTQRSNPGLPQCRQVLYQLSHKGNPRILECIAYPFSRDFVQRVLLTQESNQGLLHCRQILYQLSHKGNPRILEWVPYPFSSRSSWPRNQTRVFCIAEGFFTNWVIREAQSS